MLGASSTESTNIHIIKVIKTLIIKTSIYRQESWEFILDLHCVNHQGAQFQLKIFTTLLLKKKVDYILDGLRVGKLTENVIFFVNYRFNIGVRGG